MSETLLRVENLRVDFLTPYGRLRAVDGVSLTVAPGQTLGIVGESGSGKTVVSRSILGLLPPTATITADSVTFGQVDLTGAPEAALRRLRGKEIGVIFQDPMTSLNPVLTIGRQITESLSYHLGMNATSARQRAEELLSAVGIPVPERRIDEYPHQLSGGMRQRVVIAIALSCEPRLLIADEPTTALDVTVQAQILDLLQRYQREHGMALIIITHDLGVVAGRTDEVAVMYAGRVVERASTTELFGNVRMPYTEALLSSIPRLEDEPHRRLQAIGGRPPNLIAPPPGCAFHPRCQYAQSRCRAQRPDLKADADEAHRYACWFPVGTTR